MSSTGTRKKYDVEFKKRAVLLSYSSVLTLQEVADSLGLHVQLFYRRADSILPREKRC